MKLKEKAKKIIFIAAMTVAVIALASCTYPFTSAKMTCVNTDSGAKIPQVSGFWKNDEINEKLEDIFTPYAEWAQKTVSDSDGELQVLYRFDEDEENKTYTISMSIGDKNNNSIYITEAKISGKSDVSAVSPSDISWLDSADVITSTFALNDFGIDVDITQMSGDADREFAVGLMIDIYETFIGEELDVSDVTVGSALGEDFKKALKLGLIDCYYNADEYTYGTDYEWYDALNMTAVMLKSIERDAYGRQSDIVTGDEFADILGLLRESCVVSEEISDTHRWSDFLAVDMTEVITSAEKNDTELKRRDAAELLWDINKLAPTYKISFNDKNLPVINDSTNVWVRRVMKYEFMTYYGDFTLFAPLQKMTLVNAIQNAEVYVNKKYSDWQFATDYSYTYNYTKYDMIVLANAIIEYFDDRPEAERNAAEVKTVINDRDYNWFYSQLNTGEYSAVNCMPSIATMAAHWYDQNSSATVEGMRATSDLTDGWTAFELRNGLDSYNIPYTVVNATLENILEALDQGKIVLAQYSDRPYSQSGHCYVIYGYRKFNDSVTFIINDSDSLTDRANIFGRSKGNGDELEANFSMWSIKRFVSDVTVIG